MTTLYSNNVAALLAANIGPSDAALLLTAGQGARFPSPVPGESFYITLIHVGTGAIEIALCTARAVDTLTIVRGQDGTLPISFTTGSAVEMRLVAKMLRDVDYNLARGAVNGLASLGPDGFVPDFQIAPSFTRDTELAAAVAGLQPSLGFTPVQQGTGVDQQTNIVKIGWKASSKLGLTVDATEIGDFAMEGWVSGYLASLVNTPNGIAGLDGAGLVPVARVPALPYLPIGGGTITGPLTVNGLTTLAALNASGAVAAAGYTSTQNYSSAGGAVVLATTGAGVCYLRPNGAGSAAGELQLSAAGVATAVNFTATSDYRLKKNVRGCDARAYAADLLEWSAFEWKDTGKSDLGLIAQHVQKVTPEHVYEREDGMLTVDKASLALELVIGLASRLRNVEEKTNA